jgi:Thioredoxin like C-terminal domain
VHPASALPRPTDVPDTTPDNPNLSPETYLGSERAQYYAGTGRYATGQFTAPARLPANSFGLAGSWTVAPQSITAGNGAEIKLAYNAADVYLDIGGTGTLTVSSGGATKIIHVSGTRHLHRRHRAARAGRDGHDQALTRPGGLLLHLRLAEPGRACAALPWKSWTGRREVTRSFGILVLGFAVRRASASRGRGAARRIRRSRARGR